MKKFLILLLLAASSFNSVFALDKPQEKIKESFTPTTNRMKYIRSPLLTD